MKILNISLQERFIWVLAIGFLAFFAENRTEQIDRLHSIIQTYELESNIKNAQFLDLGQTLLSSANTEYLKGFEAGKTQAGVAFMDDRSLYDYADGYHQALSQFGGTDQNNQQLSNDVLIDMLLSNFIDENKTEEITNSLNID